VERGEIDEPRLLFARDRERIDAGLAPDAVEEVLAVDRLADGGGGDREDLLHAVAGAVAELADDLALHPVAAQHLGRARGRQDGEPEVGQSLEFYQTQYSLLASKSLAERVARTLNLANDAAFLRAFKSARTRYCSISRRRFRAERTAGPRHST